MARYTVELTDEQARFFQVRGYLPGPVHQALASAIRANPPKPPRMPEPGWGERVVARTNDSPTRREFLHYTDHLIGGRWIEQHNASVWIWDDLIDPEPVAS